MQNVRKTQLLLIAITVAVLAPFLNKAFHIDDPLFLWMAQQIAKHPLDPYGFSVNWATSPQPMWEVMQNPPLCSYYIAAVGSLIGWSEPALHFGFLLWPIMSILATFAMARRFCREPFIAVLLTLFTPAFLGFLVRRRAHKIFWDQPRSIARRLHARSRSLPLGLRLLSSRSDRGGDRFRSVDENAIRRRHVHGCDHLFAHGRG